MSFWTAIVCIVAIGALANVISARTKAKRGVIEDADGNERFVGRFDSEYAAVDEAAQKEIRELKERVAVLERIATDKNSTSALDSVRIASEIEALRNADQTAQPN